MKIAELLARDIESESNDLSYLCGYGYKHIKEISDYPSHATQVTIKWLKKHDHARRIWIVGFLCFDGKPCMVFQNGGREGDDVFNRWIFDETAYINAVRAITGGTKVEVPELTKIEWNIPELANFYGYTLDSNWEEIDLDHF
jgi:hypothetical protein